MALRSGTRPHSPAPAPLPGSNRLSWEQMSLVPQAIACEPSTWVKLHHPPTPFSFDEAWLLCQCSEDQWMAWVPDYGEVLLRTCDFSPLV